MEQGHVLSDELLEKAAGALANDKQWMAYNNSLYFIDKDDVHFFNNKEEAEHLPRIMLATLIVLMCCIFHLLKIYLNKFPTDNN